MSYESRGKALGHLVDSKQKQYGRSAEKSARILDILYPSGVQPHQYRDALLTVRVLDKLSRIAQRGPDGRDLGGESPWQDIAGYGLLGAEQDEAALPVAIVPSPAPAVTDAKGPACSLCGEELGKDFYSDVPGIGDVCTQCHRTKITK